jgi:two-component system, chemotaxis family, chemotaxis protein CheY
VLVVDDEATLRSLLQRVLQGAGFDVLEAEHGGHALQQLRGLAGSVSLVVTDINMPVMDGVEFVRRFRPQHPLTPVLFITGRGNEDQRVGVCLETWGEILRKPFTPDLFLDRVMCLMSRGVDAERTIAEA